MCTVKAVGSLFLCFVAAVSAEKKGAWWWMGGRQQIPDDEWRRWINPCGVRPADTPSIWELDVNRRPTPENWIHFLEVLLTRINRARKGFEQFRERYVSETFQVTFFQHHHDWKDHDYDWLPKLPKKLGEPTPQEHLETLYLDVFSGWSSHWLAVVDVGLEQVLWDWQIEEDDGFPKYRDAFEHIWFTNTNVLCDVWTWVRDLGLEPMPDVDRDIMGPEFRDIEDETTRNLRDWIIFRSYMNLLEYMQDCLVFFLKDGTLGPWFSSLLARGKSDRFSGQCAQWLQIVDVGLEQVMWDWQLEADQENFKYKDAFEDIWRTNNIVLCYVWTYVRDLGLQPTPDVTRDIMIADFRDVHDETTRNIRDWIIFRSRSYMNLLEYMRDCLDFFLKGGYLAGWFSSLILKYES